MKHARLLLPLFLSSLACTDPEPPPTTTDAGIVETPDAGQEGPARISMATWNTHLFFDTTCDTGNCGPDEFEQQPSVSQFEAKADEVANAIRELDADVVTLQEIENQDCLNAIKERLPEYPVAILGESNAPASPDVAVLAKGALMTTRTHGGMILYRPDGSSTRFSREFLEVHVDMHGERVIVFAAHFRSKANDDPGRRQAEAKAAKQIVTSVGTTYPDATVLLGGDLNDTPGSAPINELEGDGTLLRVAAELPGDEDATYTFQGDPEAIDHIFITASSAGEYITGTVEVMKEGTVRRWGGSDHAALRAEFDLRPE